MDIKISNLTAEQRAFVNGINDDGPTTSQSMALARAIMMSTEDNTVLLDKLCVITEVDVESAKHFIRCWDKVYKKPTIIREHVNPLHAVLNITSFAPNEIAKMGAPEFTTLSNQYVGLLNGL